MRVESVGHPEPGIAQLDVIRGPAIRQVSEFARVPGDVNDCRIDVVEGQVLTRLSVASEAAGTEADEGQVLLGEFVMERFEKLADRSRFVVVRQGLMF